MADERILILNMLKEGRISVEEADKLLGALRGHGKHGRFHDDQMEQFENKARKVGDSVDSFVKDFGSKIEGAYKDVEPTIKKATKTALEKTASIVDKISKSLNESIKCREEELCDDEPVGNGERPTEDLNAEFDSNPELPVVEEDKEENKK